MKIKHSSHRLFKRNYGYSEKFSAKQSRFRKHGYPFKPRHFVISTIGEILPSPRFLAFARNDKVYELRKVSRVKLVAANIKDFSKEQNYFFLEDDRVGFNNPPNI